jgi:hypothetical protein
MRLGVEVFLLPAPNSISPENSCSWRTAGYSRVIEQDETELKHERHPQNKLHFLGSSPATVYEVLLPQTAQVQSQTQ